MSQVTCLVWSIETKCARTFLVCVTHSNWRRIPRHAGGIPHADSILKNSFSNACYSALYRAGLEPKVPTQIDGHTRHCHLATSSSGLAPLHFSSWG